MITRPTSLLIIVGDHNALSLNKNWSDIVNLCSDERALLQENRTLHPRVMF